MVELLISQNVVLFDVCFLTNYCIRHSCFFVFCEANTPQINIMCACACECVCAFGSINSGQRDAMKTTTADISLYASH